MGGVIKMTYGQCGFLVSFFGRVLQQEKSAIGQDRATLKDVARNSGGAYLTIDQADETLPGLLEARAEIRRLTAEYSPCRHWAYYTALALILALAWFIRKRSGLA